MFNLYRASAISLFTNSQVLYRELLFRNLLQWLEPFICPQSVRLVARFWHSWNRAASHHALPQTDYSFTSHALKASLTCHELNEPSRGAKIFWNPAMSHDWAQSWRHYALTSLRIDISQLQWVMQISRTQWVIQISRTQWVIYMSRTQWGIQIYHQPNESFKYHELYDLSTCHDLSESSCGAEIL